MEAKLERAKKGQGDETDETTQEMKGLIIKIQK